VWGYRFSLPHAFMGLCLINRWDNFFTFTFNFTFIFSCKHHSDFSNTSSFTFKWLITMHWWFSKRNKTKKYIYRYVNLLWYKQRSLLYVLTTTGGRNIEKATLFVIKHICIHICIQGVTGGMWKTSGECSLC